MTCFFGIITPNIRRSIMFVPSATLNIQQTHRDERERRLEMLQPSSLVVLTTRYLCHLHFSRWRVEGDIAK